MLQPQGEVHEQGWAPTHGERVSECQGLASMGARLASPAMWIGDLSEPPCSQVMDSKGRPPPPMAHPPCCPGCWVMLWRLWIARCFLSCCYYYYYFLNIQRSSEFFSKLQERGRTTLKGARNCSGTLGSRDVWGEEPAGGSMRGTAPRGRCVTVTPSDTRYPAREPSRSFTWSRAFHGSRLPKGADPP